MTKLKVEPRGDREILITRMFDASRDLVFDAHTKPELVRRWLLGPPGWTMPVCEIDLRVGGRFRYVWRNADGRDMGMGGVYREIVRSERIVSTEIFDEDWTGGETVNTLTFTEQAGRTTMTNVVLYSTADARDGALKSGMTDGMEAGYALLDNVLAKS
jgi:uncharacterized protein YndB with AHSA1/START domain